MQIYRTRADWQSARQTITGSLGFVPTMGNIHDGHLALIQQARAECDHVIVSIYVNPTQFEQPDDFTRYPRTVNRDRELLAPLADSLLLPNDDEIYPRGDATRVLVDAEVGGLSERLLGRIRPGHFHGVTTVVHKLLQIVTPDRAYFGEKDLQQLTLIRQMTHDLFLPVDIVSVPTVREPDGVALSSRNSLLTPEQRTAARIIPAALEYAQQNRHQPPADLINTVRDFLTTEPLAEPVALDFCEANTLQPVVGHWPPEAVFLLAVRFDPVLLIDHCLIQHK